MWAVLTTTTDASDPLPQKFPSTLSSRRFSSMGLSSHHKMNNQVSPLPPVLRLSDELLLQIFECVDQPKLKGIQLTCRKLTYAATTTLYSRLHLKSNIGSFCRLYSICLYPELSNIDKTLSYSGKMLRTSDFAGLLNSTTTQSGTDSGNVGEQMCRT